MLLPKTSFGKDPKAGLQDPKGAPGAEVGPLLPALARAAAHRADEEQAVRQAEGAAPGKARRPLARRGMEEEAREKMAEATPAKRNDR